MLIILSEEVNKMSWSILCCCGILMPFQDLLEMVFFNRRYSTIRNQSDKLLELLELPSLMREALNAEDYESALDIFAFIRNLSKRYSEIPIVEVRDTHILISILT